MLANIGGGGYLGGYLSVLVGVGIAHDQVFELGLDFVEPEAMRQRNVEVGGLAGDDELLGVLHRVEGAHVVQTVAELEEDNVGVVAHGEQYLAIVLGLFALGLLDDHDVVNLGDAVDNGGHTLAKDHAQFVEGDIGVLYHIVQQGADDGNGAQAHLFDSYQGNSQRMEDIGLTALAARAGMGTLGHAVGTQDACLFVGRERLQVAAGGNEFIVLGLYLQLFPCFVNLVHGLPEKGI